jgi:2-polyprenyl-3-methyl-5-hydroxy-6-metoxy-1,4-benzoquinol methylase
MDKIKNPKSDDSKIVSNIVRSTLIIYKFNRVKMVLRSFANLFCGDTKEAIMLYDPRGVRDFYDHYGTREWERLEQTLQGRIKYAIHRHFLDSCVPVSACVLDAGCGPGRFAIHLARRGARLTLVDLSQNQLDLAQQHLKEAGLLEKIESFRCLDIVDLHELADASFDVVVCYGAAVSYTCDRYGEALRELARVIRPGGRLLISVISLYGTLRLLGPYDDQGFLISPDEHVDWQAVLSGKGVVYSRPGSTEFHQPMALFSSAGLQQALEQAGLKVVKMAAVNPVVSEGAQIPRISDNPQAAAALTTLEVAICSSPGLVDSGEHLLAVADKP